VLPGGLYVWSFERVVGRWGIGLADRLLRLVAASAVFLAVFAAPLYLFWTELSEHRLGTGRRSVAEFLAHGEVFPWWVYLCLIGYVSVPIVLGTLAGRAVRSRDPRWKGVGRLIGGKAPRRGPGISSFRRPRVRRSG
jgi:hypothetical protein